VSETYFDTMSMLLTCSLLGEDLILACGATREVVEQLEVVIPDEEARPVPDRALSKRQDSEWFSCEDEVPWEKGPRKAPSTAVPSDPSEGNCSDEVSQWEASPACSQGTTNSQAALPSFVVDKRVEDLQQRLAGLLESSDAARGTIEKLGGYPACHWRFLRASGYSLDDAEQKLRETVEFRVQEGVNQLLQTPAALEVHEQLREVWPEVNLGITGDGSPISFFDVGKAVRFLQLGVDEERLRLFWLTWMERSYEIQCHGRRMATGSSSVDPHDIPGTVVVYDLKELRLSQITSCLSGLHQFCRVLGLAEKHYPCALRKAIVLNAPSVFSRMVWPLVQKVLDAETRANVVVCESLQALSYEELGFSPRDVQQLLAGRV